MVGLHTTQLRGEGDNVVAGDGAQPAGACQPCAGGISRCVLQSEGLAKTAVDLPPSSTTSLRSAILATLRDVVCVESDLAPCGGRPRLDAFAVAESEIVEHAARRELGEHRASLRAVPPLNAATLWRAIVRRTLLVFDQAGLARPTLPQAAPFVRQATKLRDAGAARRLSHPAGAVSWPGVVGCVELHVDKDTAACVTKVIALIADVALGKDTRFGSGTIKPTHLVTEKA